MQNDKADNGLLVLQVLLNLIDGVKSLGLALHIFGLILVIVILLANKQFLLEALLSLLLSTLNTSASHLVGSSRCRVLSRSGSLCLARLLVVLFVHLTHI